MTAMATGALVSTNWLKEHLDDKDETIEVERRDDEDWLRLTKAEVS